MGRSAVKRLLALCIVFSLFSCVTTQNSTTSDSRWLAPSPQLREQIEENIERLPYTHHSDRIQLVQWFAEVGEPAYPWLLELTQDEREGVASSAISALGSTRDARLVEVIHELEWPTPEEDFERALAKARALLWLGDWSEIPVLIQGLESDRLWTRALCAKTLQAETNDLHGFDPRGEPAERAEAVAAWKAWWTERSSDPLLEASMSTE